MQIFLLQSKISVNRLLCLKWVTNKDILRSTENSAQCFLAAWMGREFGENEYLSHSADYSAPETITTLISFTPIQNKKFFKS